VGEMKILYHPKNQTYRMLLRREQIFKLVLNQLISADIHMAPMENSPKAFCWAGMNYAEGNGEAEQLAIRFKNEDLATKFKAKLEECQAKMESSENLHPEND
jgi:E3 SUMO-protein ligase RanBP2